MTRPLIISPFRSRMSSTKDLPFKGANLQPLTFKGTLQKHLQRLPAGSPLNNCSLGVCIYNIYLFNTNIVLTLLMLGAPRSSSENIIQIMGCRPNCIKISIELKPCQGNEVVKRVAFSKIRKLLMNDIQIHSDISHLIKPLNINRWPRVSIMKLLYLSLHLVFKYPKSLHKLEFDFNFLNQVQCRLPSSSSGLLGHFEQLASCWYRCYPSRDQSKPGTYDSLISVQPELETRRLERGLSCKQSTWDRTYIRFEIEPKSKENTYYTNKIKPPPNLCLLPFVHAAPPCLYEQACLGLSRNSERGHRAFQLWYFVLINKVSQADVLDIGAAA